MSAEETLRVQARAALRDRGISQAAAARQLGLSTKHMCQMLTGSATLTLDWAEQLLGLCGMRLVVGLELATNDEPQETPDA